MYSFVILILQIAENTVLESQRRPGLGWQEPLFLERFLSSFSNISLTELMYEPENRKPEVSRQ